MEVWALVSWSILLEHFAALALLWASVLVPGFAIVSLLPHRLGLAAIAPLGVVYWSVSLYLIPFSGGLDIAAGLAIVLASIGLARWWREGAARPALSWPALILAIGSVPYVTTLLFHYVPFGMDGSMHATAATLIAETSGLPRSHAPFMPEVALPPMNLGLPAVAGVAIRWGGEPAAVMLASHHLTFTTLLLATYVLLRAWIGCTPSALLAVASVWMARASQSSLEWGGFPTVMSVAVGVLAARLILEQSENADWRISLAAGACIAAIPLIHGVGGGTWIYCIGPCATLGALLQSSQKWTTARGVAIAGITAAGILFAYRMTGSVELQPSDLDMTHQWQLESASLGDNIWLGAVDFIRRDSGSVLFGAGWLALAILVIRRQWGPALLLTAAWTSMVVVIANVQSWFLPASFLLYPERALYWVAPLSAVCSAFAWRSLYSEPEAQARDWRNSLACASALYSEPEAQARDWRRSLACASGSVLLLVIAGYFHNIYYQKIVRQDFVNADGWEALQWAKSNLQPQRDFVQAPYRSTGSFLPAVARIACTGAHHHHFLARPLQAAYRQRNITHVLIDQALAPQTAIPAGEIVFQNRTITIIKIG